MKNVIDIWNPKYKTDSVLIATYKVAEENTIIFTKAKHLEGKEYNISGDDIRQFPIVTNGKISCYDVPMSALTLTKDNKAEKEDKPMEMDEEYYDMMR